MAEGQSPPRSPRWPVLLALALPLALAFTWRFWAKTESPTSIAGNGRQLYARCQACHGSDGSGLRGYAPPLVGSKALRADPASVAERILGGGTPAPGAWSSQMPPFAQQFSDAEVALLVHWLHQTWGDATLPPMTPDDVARIRARLPTNPR